MNRVILFRGKDAIYREWIYGDLLTYASCTQIWQDSDSGKFPASVIPETVGQYTGLYDKNGVRIFENDIVIIGGNKSFPTMIEFLSGSWQCVRKYTDKGRENEYSYLHRLEYDNPNQYEVIGNRFDNPELLKG